MRFLALVLSVALLAAAGAREASAGTAPPPCGDTLAARAPDDHAPPAWHFDRRGGRLGAVAR